MVRNRYTQFPHYHRLTPVTVFKLQLTKGSGAMASNTSTTKLCDMIFGIVGNEEPEILGCLGNTILDIMAFGGIMMLVLIFLYVFLCNPGEQGYTPKSSARSAGYGISPEARDAARQRQWAEELHQRNLKTGTMA